MRVLVANRGEIAIRIFRTASELGFQTAAVFSEDDAASPHLRWADAASPLAGSGPAAYLDIEAILEAARATSCDAIHPGYGFLAESARFARRCAEEGLMFVGPRSELLEEFGDKTRARNLAARCGVPVLPGTSGPTSLEEARAFLASLEPGTPVAVKAVHGGGGRGLRVVRRLQELDEAFERCRSEAASAFGRGDLYLERYLPRARHVEVQVLADRAGNVSHLWERECTLQRRHQKLVEVAPSPSLSAGLRERLLEAAVRIARAARYENVGTFEFLVDLDAEPSFAFLEANPRLQVEHPVTEEVTGVDLVAVQFRLAAGASLRELGLDAASRPTPRGGAIELRINAETLAPDGSVRPAAGTVTGFELPGGPGIRVDTCAGLGYAPNPRFDPLLAKLIVRSPQADWSFLVARARRALGELRVEGIPTNAGFLRALLDHPEVRANRIHTGFVEDRAGELLARAAAGTFGARPGGDGGVSGTTGSRADRLDPLAVLEHGKKPRPRGSFGAGTGDRVALGGALEAPPGAVAVRSPIQGTVVSVAVREGDTVGRGEELLVLEAMKMEHLVTAPSSGVVRRLVVSAGDIVREGAPLAYLEEVETEAAADRDERPVDLDRIRPDLAEVLRRHEIGLDAARPSAVESRRRSGQRTARENIADLCDPGTFVEYGPLVIAAQRRRRSVEELIERTPADGLVAGVGSVNGDLFGPERSQCVVLAYDYTVLAGTQGIQNHRKKDRMFELAERRRLPVVIFTEGGGGRPGDTDGVGVAGLDCMAFVLFARLSGLVPLVAINSGRCFAGNAALLGCSDVVIACADSSIGMGGPAMIEGGGLGVFHPDEVGPMSVQVPNGVVDLPVADEAEGVRVAKRYLSYFQGRLRDWQCADQRLLRECVPENRLRVYDIRRVIEILADTGSVLELRRAFGPGMVTALARIEGRPIGIVANDPAHLAGAIDSDGADKAARFLQLCDAFDLPILFLCDTPGILVGPDIEKRALVRHAARLFVVGASLTVPFFTIVLRKGYGLGAQAMAGGSFKAPLFTVAWPTGEFGGMGLEGAVKLGYRKELAAVEDPLERRKLFQEMVARLYEQGKAVNMASHFEIDDVIDPADSRRWVAAALRSLPDPPRRRRKKRPCVDTW